jgi:DNA-directed RNA polymerase specialized sigma24 family protein
MGPAGAFRGDDESAGADGMTSDSLTRDFEAFVDRDGERLRRALVAHYGVDVGAELHADALARAWADWDRVGAMDNAAGYLYRYATSRSRHYRRWARAPRFPGPAAVSGADAGLVELLLCLGRLSPPQRVAVLLVHAYGASYAEVAEVLGVPVTTVTNHVTRGVARLRKDLHDD